MSEESQIKNSPNLTWEVPSSYFKKKNFLNFLSAGIAVIVVMICFTVPLIYVDGQLGIKSLLADYMGLIIFVVGILVVWVSMLIINGLYPYKKVFYEINSQFFAVTKGETRRQYNLSEIESYRAEGAASSTMFLRNNVLISVTANVLVTFLRRKDAHTPGVKRNFVIRLKGNDKKDIILVTTDKNNSQMVLEVLKVYLPEIFHKNDPLYFNS